MAEMTIRLQIDPNTGKKDIFIGLHADADALPHEHEQHHRALVERLIEGGLLKASELGQVIVERVEEERKVTDPVIDATAESKAAERQQHGARCN